MGLDIPELRAHRQEKTVRIVFHPHARQRMEERGVSGTEVRKAVREGIVVPARRGRKKHQLIFPFERYWLSRLYRSRLVDVYSVEERDVMIVLTGVEEYF